jgi:hypothetical protein
MRRVLVVLVAVVFVNAVPALASEVTVTGELVDHVCFNRSGADGMGPDHAECAKSCASGGQPVALVTASGDVYMLAGTVAADNNAALVPHMSHTVEVTGELGEVDGIPTITAEAVKHVSAG